MKSIMERPKDVEYIHDEYFGVGSCEGLISFDELEKTKGSKWRKKKGFLNSYKPREDKIFSRLKMLAHAVRKVREEKEEEEVDRLMVEWQVRLDRKGLAPLILYLQDEGIARKGKARKKREDGEVDG